MKSDENAEKLQKVYEETEKQLKNAVKRIQDCNEKAEGYIAISQFREDKRKQKHYEEHGYFGTSNQSQNPLKEQKHRHSTKQVGVLVDEIKVSYSLYTVNIKI